MKFLPKKKYIITSLLVGFFFVGVSVVLILISLGFLFTKGLNLGVDFTGGIVLHILRTLFHS